MFGTTLDFTQPGWLWILPLPAIIHFLVPAYKTKRAAIKVPFFRHLTQALNELPTQGASQLQPARWQRGTLIFAWLLIVLALCQPTILGEPQTREKRGRDLMIAMDLSGSMSEKDFTMPDGKQVDRLTAAKHVLSDFSQNRDEDRLGLILFGDAAYVQTPFTADHHVWRTLMEQTQVAMAGESTHLGDAIGLTIKMFEERSNTDAKEKVAVIFTDGNDTGSFVAPIDAAKIAAVKGVRIHIIAMGSPDTVGEQAMNMETINTIAKLTGGRAFEALSSKELQQAYAEINRLEPALYESSTYRPKVSLQYGLISCVLVVYLIAFMLLTLKRIRQPARQADPSESSHV